MSSYVVAYDLHQRGQNYECLSKKLKAYGVYFHIQGSVWLIRTADTAKMIRDNLMACLDHNDKLLVAELSGAAAWAGYSRDDAEWLKNYL